MMLFRKFVLVVFLIAPFNSYSDENIEQSKFFVENLGKQVVEKVSNVNLSENERHVNFRDLYLNSFDNYYISRFVLGDIGRDWMRYEKTIC